MKIDDNDILNTAASAADHASDTHWQPDGAVDGVERFIEQMGLSAQADGVPRIAGRIFGYFIVHGGPVSFAQLAKELQVSRASVSTNARVLSSIGFIERVSRPGDRQDYYQLAESPFLRMIEGYMERMRRMQTILVQANGSIPEEMVATRRRLAQMSHFYEVAVRSNEQLLRDLGQSESSM
ncbi:MAG: MarR family transcriptional regulator [Gammaproteobacteria bacterium]|nr:MarR family transcriptional regulator [Gammaproteobacteria bacterium]MDP2140491.1 MarR family transcriptional regulator [Gammaproteobacteria bacterium]MDP2348800.1 MarR family transcriptional regulator [Gammaproteobacteria bacterium]